MNWIVLMQIVLLIILVLILLTPCDCNSKRFFREQDKGNDNE